MEHLNDQTFSFGSILSDHIVTMNGGILPLAMWLVLASVFGVLAIDKYRNHAKRISSNSTEQKNTYGAKL
jgi:hypothetical protein